LEAAREAGSSVALLVRLELTHKRFQELVAGVHEVD